jgi:hypothetical protein
MLLNDIPQLDALLRRYSTELGKDFTAYRNHVYRDVNLCIALSSGGPEETDKIVLAAVYHDLGIWTDKTFDYLSPSAELAKAHLRRTGRSEWSSEIEEMILEHHKITSYRGHLSPLIEAFRRADWIDVSRGLRTFGLPRSFVRDVFATWPDAGFHKRLAQMELDRLISHPWNPLPMIKL